MWQEDNSSLLPALELLQKLGWQYLSPTDALALRGGVTNKVVLEGVLESWLAQNNRFEVGGHSHAFSERNIKQAVQRLSGFRFEGLHTSSTQLYDLLMLGASYEETVDGNKRSYNMAYIDWQHPANNVYHVSDEFSVERSGSTEHYRPDVVLFVNGIPLAVIECKRPDKKGALEEAISQHIRNQQADGIPLLYCMAQVLVAACQHDARYATIGSSKDYWLTWREEDEDAHDAHLATLHQTPLTDEALDAMFVARDKRQRTLLSASQGYTGRMVSAQDRLLASVLSPERLLLLARQFIVFDGNVKKIARYQQVFAVQATLARVRPLRADGTRQGGVVWHTTGSGKSLTMVMLAKVLALEPSIRNPKIILVTDRVDLDKQIKNTFVSCGVEVVRAKNGAHLGELVNMLKAEVITSVIDKFDATAKAKVKNDNPNVFVLVDESHRSQYGTAHAQLTRVFPNACYLGFTGTPLLKKDKNTATKFGGFIHKYTMPQAVKDGAVRPLLYQGRDSDFRNSQAVDRWFDRIAKGLTDAQKADLKRKYQSAEPLYDAEAHQREIAFDICEHFTSEVRPQGLKGQLATSSKIAAISYKKLLDDMSDIRSAVVISSPDTREGHSDVSGVSTPIVQAFWTKTVAPYSSERAYEESVIASFKGDSEDGIELLIVVDKLLTGFDAPRNAVLYLDKRLKEHNILQAIARVNRVFAGKDYGLIIDYRGIFGEMEDALDMYAALEAQGFDPEDVAGTLTDVWAEIEKLSTHYEAVWQVFRGVDSRDQEALQQHLQPQDRREAFYVALLRYSKTLQLALSSPQWLEETDEASQRRYKRDLVFFVNLRKAVQVRYQERIDFGKYEAQLRTMIQKEIGAEAVKTLADPVAIINIEDIDTDDIDKDVDVPDTEGDAAKADTIAARVKKVITERMEEDPLLHKKLSALIDDAIAAHRAKRLSDTQYLQRVRQHAQTLRQGGDDVPAHLRQRPAAKAHYHLLQDRLELTAQADKHANQDVLAELASAIDDTITAYQVRDWQRKDEVIKQIFNALDDLLADFEQQGVVVPWDDIDPLLHKCVDIAKHHARHYARHHDRER